MGLARKQRVTIDQPFLFTYTARPGDRSIAIKMVPLNGAPGWTHRLPLPFEELYNDGLPQPAVSTNIAAVAYLTRSPSNLARNGAHIELVDREGGFRRSNLLLSPEMSKSRVKVYGLGDCLLILGTGRVGNRDISQIEVMQSVR